MAITLRNAGGAADVALNASSAAPTLVLTNGAQSAGDTIVVAIGADNGSAISVTSVTDTSGNPYQQGVARDFSGTVQQTIWFAANVAAAVSGANTLTVHFTAVVTNIDLRSLVYGGLAAVPFDVAAMATGSGATASSGNATTTVNGDLIIGAGVTSGGFTAVGAGFGHGTITSPNGDIIEDRIQATAGAIAATAAQSGSYVMQMLALKAAAAAPAVGGFDPPARRGPPPRAPRSQQPDPLPAALALPVLTPNFDGQSRALRAPLGPRPAQGDPLPASLALPVLTPSGWDQSTRPPPRAPVRTTPSAEVLSAIAVPPPIAPWAFDRARRPLFPRRAVIAPPEVFPALTSGPAWPLKVSANGRHAVDQNSVPFDLRGEAAWTLMTRTTGANVDAYIADRAAKGFNLARIMLIVTNGLVDNGVGANEPANLNGDNPFSNITDFSTTQTPYFNYCATVLSKFYAANFAIMLAYTYWGNGPGSSAGWWNYIAQVANTNTVCFNWGVFIGNLIAPYPNIILESAGDANVTPPTTETTRSLQILAGIKSVCPNLLGDAEFNSPNEGLNEQTVFAVGKLATTSNLQLNTVYGYGGAVGTDPSDGHTYFTGDRTWNQVSAVDGTPMPSLVGESSYEGESNQGTLATTREAQRNYRYWAVLSGLGAGFCFGNHLVSLGRTGWLSAFNSDGALDMAVYHALRGAIEWWRQQPSKTTAHNNCGRTLVAAGQGTSGNDDWISSSIADNGTCLLAFVPTDGSASTRTFSVDLRSMSGASRARWFNTTIGVYTAIAGGGFTFANTLSAQSFTTPGDNGTAQNDWVLILDTQGAAPSVSWVGDVSSARPVSRSPRPSPSDALPALAAASLIPWAPDVPAVRPLPRGVTLGAREAALPPLLDPWGWDAGAARAPSASARVATASEPFPPLAPTLAAWTVEGALGALRARSATAATAPDAIPPLVPAVPMWDAAPVAVQRAARPLPTSCSDAWPALAAPLPLAPWVEEAASRWPATRSTGRLRATDGPLPPLTAVTPLSPWGWEGGARAPWRAPAVRTADTPLPPTVVPWGWEAASVAPPRSPARAAAAAATDAWPALVPLPPIGVWGWDTPTHRPRARALYPTGDPAWFPPLDTVPIVIPLPDASTVEALSRPISFIELANPSLVSTVGRVD